MNSLTYLPVYMPASVHDKSVYNVCWRRGLSRRRLKKHPDDRRAGGVAVFSGLAWGRSSLRRHAPSDVLQSGRYRCALTVYCAAGGRCQDETGPSDLKRDIGRRRRRFSLGLAFSSPLSARQENVNTLFRRSSILDASYVHTAATIISLAVEESKSETIYAIPDQPHRPTRSRSPFL